MRLLVNGTEHQLPDPISLAEVLKHFSYDGLYIATAVNGWFVPVAERATTILTNGDEIEVVAPMQGG